MATYNKIDIALGGIWMFSRENKKDLAVIKKYFQDEFAEDFIPSLKQRNYILVHNKKVFLTPLGEKRAQNILRKYHLAKKFANDILEVAYNDLEEFSLNLQEIFTETITDRVCTFLGHPKYGLNRREIIFPGKCCETLSPEATEVIIPITKLALGEEATVAYVSTRSQPVLHQLMAFGIYPGVSVRVVQYYPAYIVQTEDQQVSLEEKVAKGIYVRR
ncbi:MAG: metal-dependent transcriptional regulator [Candidatus Margulisbacteria bacterium]|nr:metal-dependent transcriptional regulator [Candidatus Margulisiibacteriota bacterium]